MPFQFYCPQGHLLEASESHAGQQSQCPLCGMAMVIPAPPAAVTVAPAAAPSGPAAEHDPVAAMRRALEGGATPALEPLEPKEELVHLFCPNGHELETPTEMLGQLALCPHCQAQFRLRMRDTREYKQEQLRKEQEFNRKVLRWAITTAVIVGLGLLGIALYSGLT